MKKEEIDRMFVDGILVPDEMLHDEFNPDGTYANEYGAGFGMIIINNWESGEHKAFLETLTQAMLSRRSMECHWAVCDRKSLSIRKTLHKGIYKVTKIHLIQSSKIIDSGATHCYLRLTVES